MKHNNLLKICGLIFIATLISVQPVLSESARSVEASSTVSSLRPDREVRLWTFTHKAKEIGTLVSTMRGTTRINDRQAIIIFDSLAIDYSKMGFGDDRFQSVWGDQYVSSVGSYLGTELSMYHDTTIEQFSLRLNADPDRKLIEGYFTRDGWKLNRSLTLNQDMFSWDIHLVDQLELWLAMQPLSVGDSLIDTLFSPQSLLTTPIRGLVKTFMNREIYANKFDSVFVIELDLPQRLQLSFTPAKKLVRVDFLANDIRAYQDFVGIPQTKTTTTANRAETASFTLIGRTIILLLVGFGCLMILAHDGIKNLVTYIMLLFGAALCALMLLVMVPIQSWLMSNLLPSPNSQALLFYLAWAVPALILALVQEGSKAATIYYTLLWRNPQSHLFGAAGAALGVGFGLAESIYLTNWAYLTSLLDWSLMGHIFSVLFHATAGSLIGIAIASGRKKIISYVSIALLVNFIIKFMPGFVMRGLFDIQVSILAVSLISTLFLLVVLIIGRNRQV